MRRCSDFCSAFRNTPVGVLVPGGTMYSSTGCIGVQCTGVLEYRSTEHFTLYMYSTVLRSILYNSVRVNLLSLLHTRVC
jgi:hypothetical protein